VAQSEITLPPDCLLRKANSSDRLEFKKLERQQVIRILINIFLQFLAFLLGIIVSEGLSFIISNPSFIALVVGLLWLPSVFRLILIFFSNKTSFDLSNTWYIKCQGRLVAWAILNQNMKGSHIVCLFVVKSWRRKGLGSALINRLIQEATPPLSLVCPRKLASFYSRLGFVPSRPNSFFPPSINIFAASPIFAQYMVYREQWKVQLQQQEAR
jgi:GNAT superfamily N-acetyltransferase